MIIVNQVKCNLDQICTKEIVAKKLGCSLADIHSFEILKESVDARKEPVQFVYSVLVDVKNEEKFLPNKDVNQGEKPVYTMPEATFSAPSRPIVVGLGPSGLFTALLLAEAGYNPIVLERGSDVDQRVADVQKFWEEGILNTESNVQYGEGGAGTFSDGKLTTRIKDTRVFKVIDEFIEAGADASIRYEAHPHLGTDKLRNIVKNLRNKIIRLGGEIKFNTRFEELILNKSKAIVGVKTSQGIIDTDTVFLCLGHSAKDTIEALHKQDVCIEPKGFSVGVRVEHPQQFIDKNQYGINYNHPRLKAAEYHLTHTATNGRGVYSFCMCPGGFVIPSSSIENTIVLNGMSEQSRDQVNGNSAILVQVPVTDFYKDSVLDGFSFQEELERKAFQLSGSYKAPTQLIQDYLNNQVSSASQGVQPSYCLGTEFHDLNQLFTPEINAALHEGLHAFNRKIPGFIEGGALMIGVETRSSSPVRLTRNEDGQSTTIQNLYPCGEGAGYAGGIMSSAVDGIRLAEKYMTR